MIGAVLRAHDHFAHQLQTVEASANFGVLQAQLILQNYFNTFQHKINPSQVKRDHHDLFKQYAPIWAKEEVERAHLWASFLLSFAAETDRCQYMRLCC